MSKIDILADLRAIEEYNLIMKVITIYPDGSKHESWKLAAELFNLKNSSGEPDLRITQEVIQLAKLDRIQNLYIKTATLMKTIGDDEVKNLFWSEETRKKNWESPFVLLSYCLEVLYRMGVIESPHTTTTAIIEYMDGEQIGVKVFSERELEKESGDNPLLQQNQEDQ